MRHKKGDDHIFTVSKNISKNPDSPFDVYFYLICTYYNFVTDIINLFETNILFNRENYMMYFDDKQKSIRLRFQSRACGDI